MMSNIFLGKMLENPKMVLKKDACLFLPPNRVGVSEGEVASTFIAPEGLGGV